MVKIRTAIIFWCLTLMAFSFAMADTIGTIDINTGGKGLVPFSHRAHQDALMDCNVCHQWFYQEKEGILKLKNEGRLKKKQIMNMCIKCHKDTRKAGDASGPESCSQCHSKR